MEPSNLLALLPFILIFLVWLFSVITIIRSEKTCGNEKQAQVLLMIYSMVYPDSCLFPSLLKRKRESSAGGLRPLAGRSA